MFDEDSPTRGPDFWKFNNSLLMDTDYVELLTFKLPEFVTKHCQVSDKGLFWEMIKMEIRAFTIKYSKRKAKKKRDEETALQTKLTSIQNKLQINYNESDKIEMDKLKARLSRIEAIKTQGTIEIVRSRARWYEHGEKNSKYYYRAFSLTWSATMQIHRNKIKFLHKKRVQLPQDSFGTPTWPSFHCFGTPIWLP